jgi:transcription initiation factor TFIID TATA-box-binding protein
MVKIKIENIVASAVIGEDIDLQKLSRELERVEYDSERFPGLICRIEDPKTATLLFRSGKVVCTGARSLGDAQKAIDIIAEKVKKTGAKIYKNHKITVQNIVATCELGVELNLNAIALTLSLEKVEYEPEQFPGLVYRVEKPAMVLLIFSSGKVVCTGAREPKEIELGLNQVLEELKGAGLM